MLTYVTLAHLSSTSGPGHSDPVLAAIEDATVVQLAGLTGIDPKRVAANTAAIRGALKTRDAAAVILMYHGP